MAVRKVKKRAAPVAAPLQAGTAGFWDTHLHPFLNRYSVVLAVCLVLLASARIVSTYSELSLTVDEPQHFACGLEYLAQQVYAHHVYRPGWEHPPLARVAAALGPYLAGARPTAGSQADQEGGVNIVKASGQVDRVTFLMRIGMLPFFWMACVVVYLWSSRYTSAGIAAIATGMFTLMPPVLAHAGLATTDMALTACLLAAFFSLLVWAESPTWGRAAVLGVAAALAAISKFTALGYLPAAVVLSLVFWICVKRPSPIWLAKLARSRLATFGFAVAVGCMVVWAAYWFSFGVVEKWGVKLPAPEFFDELLIASNHSSQGHPGYLLGEASYKGWWYFFPVALSVKTPLAVLLLSFVGAWVVWRNRSQPGYLTVPAFLFGVLLPAMTSHVNIGVRHVLPIYAALSILAGLGLVNLLRFAATPATALVLAGPPVLWIVLSGALVHPDYLAYFNEIAGKEPEKILIDSDLDWGQEYKRLGRRLRELHTDRINAKFADTFLHADLYHLPPITDLDDVHPQAGWTVLGPTASKHMSGASTLTGTDIQSIQNAMQPHWFERLTPTERVGVLRLFYIPANSPLLKE